MVCMHRHTGDRRTSSDAKNNSRNKRHSHNPRWVFWATNPFHCFGVCDVSAPAHAVCWQPLPRRFYSPLARHFIINCVRLINMFCRSMWMCIVPFLSVPFLSHFIEIYTYTIYLKKSRKKTDTLSLLHEHAGPFALLILLCASLLFRF